MLIFVGSKNPSKLYSVQQAFKEYHPNDTYQIVLYSSIPDGPNKLVLGDFIKEIPPYETLISSSTPTPTPLTSPADHIIIGIEVESGVSAQPFSAEETLLGARLRSKALQSIVKNTSKDDICAKLGLSNGFEQYYTVGVEGGIEKVADLWLESGYIVIVNEKGIECVGTSARFQLAEFVIEDLNTGKELCEVVEVLSGLSDVRSKQGYMGMITNDLLGRVRAYIHGVLFAFAKFHSPPQYWDETR